MKAKIDKQTKDFKPNFIHVKKIKNGLFFVFIDFSERTDLEGYFFEEGRSGIIFGREDGEKLLMIEFDSDKVNIIGEMGKRIWQGFVCSERVYSNFFK